MTMDGALSRSVAEALNTLSVFVCPAASNAAPHELAEAVAVLKQLPPTFYRDPEKASAALNALAGLESFEVREPATAFFVALGMPLEPDGCPLHGTKGCSLTSS